MPQYPKLTIKQASIIKLPHSKKNSWGVLFFAEAMKQIPFNINRVFFIQDVKDSKAIRGDHAHKTGHEVIFCIRGSVTIHMDDGKDKQKMILNNPSYGIHWKPKLWHKLTNFSKDCVILALADNAYDPADYINDYQEFLKFKRKTNDSIP